MQHVMLLRLLLAAPVLSAGLGVRQVDHRRSQVKTLKTQVAGLHEAVEALLAPDPP